MRKLLILFCCLQITFGGNCNRRKKRLFVRCRDLYLDVGENTLHVLSHFFKNFPTCENENSEILSYLC